MQFSYQLFNISFIFAYNFRLSSITIPRHDTGGNLTGGNVCAEKGWGTNPVNHQSQINLCKPKLTKSAAKNEEWILFQNLRIRGPTLKAIVVPTFQTLHCNPPSICSMYWWAIIRLRWYLRASDKILAKVAWQTGTHQHKNRNWASSSSAPPVYQPDSWRPNKNTVVNIEPSRLAFVSPIKPLDKFMIIIFWLSISSLISKLEWGCPIILRINGYR